MASDSRVEEGGWVIQIGKLLERDDLRTVIEYPASIFKLPDCIREANPDAFLPQRIALGPNHHLRLEFYNMQPYKLHMAQKAKEELQLGDFCQLRDRVAPLELRIRACYANHLNIEGETLASMMLVDALFLLRILHNFPGLSYFEFLPLRRFDDQNLFNSLEGKLVAQFQILSDVLKLENQIPFLVLKEILSSCPSVQVSSSVYDFCESVFPFFIDSKDQDISAIFDKSHHLLHFMYLSILTLPVTIHVRGGGPTPPTTPPISFLLKFLSTLGHVLNIAFIQQLTEAMSLIRELLQILWMVKDQSSSSAHQTTSSPLIPSASQLQKLHVKFKRIICVGTIRGKGILDSEFNTIARTPTLSLPIFRMKAFTETLFENLVAFEAMANINPPVFARYLEFMKALVATPKDVKILKEEGILGSWLDSDEQVVQFFKGLGSSISTLNVNKHSLESLNHLNIYRWCPRREEVDPNEAVYEEIKDKYEKGFKKLIEEINHYHGSFRSVRAKKFVKKYAYSVLKILLLLFILGLILLVIARLLIDCLKPIISR